VPVDEHRADAFVTMSPSSARLWISESASPKPLAVAEGLVCRSVESVQEPSLNWYEGVVASMRWIG
jgi:hypothetical protein